MRLTCREANAITWHKLKTVRTRACALQESFYPTEKLPYVVVKTRMASLLGIVDRMSVLAYLGRPECEQKSVLDQIVRYQKTGATVPKRHYFSRKLKAKKGYIDLFGLGYVHVKGREWFVHWDHQTVVNELVRQVKVPPSPPSKEVLVDEGLGQVSIDDFSRSYNTMKQNARKDETIYIERQRRERDTLYEREIPRNTKLYPLNSERLTLKMLTRAFREETSNEG